MKRTDVATIIFIASLSVLVAYFVASAIIGKPSADAQRVQTIEQISSDVGTPDATIFNKDAINPTVEVTIGNQTQ